MVLKKEEESRKGIKKSSFETKNDILFPNNLDNSKNDLSCYFQVLLSCFRKEKKQPKTIHQFSELFWLEPNAHSIFSVFELGRTTLACLSIYPLSILLYFARMLP
jgi:hypothetical protein